MTAVNLKKLMSVLLVATGVLHLVVAAMGATDSLRLPLAAFGVLFGTLGVLLQRGGRTIVVAAIAACAIGLIIGGSNYVQYGGPISLPVMFLIDAIVIAAGAMCLAKPVK